MSVFFSSLCVAVASHANRNFFCNLNYTTKLPIIRQRARLTTNNATEKQTALEINNEMYSIRPCQHLHFVQMVFLTWVGRIVYL